MKTLGQLLRPNSAAPAWSVSPTWPSPACTPTRAACSPATCSSHSKGERFDAHDFLPQAAAQGAVAAIAHSGLADAGLPGVEVPDTRRALGELAHVWRQQFHLPLIAVTGSNGKTTVTQMIASILRAAAGDAAHATQGNFNNDIGVPLTLLRLNASHKLSVVELGMNHPGEIAELAALTRAHRGAGEQRAARAPGIHGHGGGRGAGERRRSSGRWRTTAWPCSRPTTPTRRCGANWPRAAVC